MDISITHFAHGHSVTSQLYTFLTRPLKNKSYIKSIVVKFHTTSIIFFCKFLQLLPLGSCLAQKKALLRQKQPESFRSKPLGNPLFRVPAFASIAVKMQSICPQRSAPFQSGLKSHSPKPKSLPIHFLSQKTKKAPSLQKTPVKKKKALGNRKSVKARCASIVPGFSDLYRR